MGPLREMRDLTEISPTRFSLGKTTRLGWVQQPGHSRKVFPVLWAAKSTAHQQPPTLRQSHGPPSSFSSVNQRHASSPLTRIAHNPHPTFLPPISCLPDCIDTTVVRFQKNHQASLSPIHRFIHRSRLRLALESPKLRRDQRRPASSDARFNRNPANTLLYLENNPPYAKLPGTAAGLPQEALFRVMGRESRRASATAKSAITTLSALLLRKRTPTSSCSPRPYTRVAHNPHSTFLPAQSGPWLSPGLHQHNSRTFPKKSVGPRLSTHPARIIQFTIQTLRCKPPAPPRDRQQQLAIPPQMIHPEIQINQTPHAATSPKSPQKRNLTKCKLSASIPPLATQ